MIRKLDEDENYKQVEMWQDDVDKERRARNAIVVIVIALGAILLGFALYFA